MIDHEVTAVRAMHEHHGIEPRPERPMPEVELPLPLLLERVDFLQEELTELQDAAMRGDREKLFDALLDLVYVAKGTAAMLGISPRTWAAGFEEVHRSQFEKTRGPGRRFGQQVDLLKPPGWRAPDLATVLADGEGRTW